MKKSGNYTYRRAGRLLLAAADAGLFYAIRAAARSRRQFDFHDRVTSLQQWHFC